jgi:uncharacterized membrane protein YfcA
MSVPFLILVGLIAFLAGATASVVGFGIGSLLTPLLATRLGVGVAVACVAIPHLAGGLLRGWRLRRSIDWPLVVRFGLVSAAGALAGALVFASLAPAMLARALGALLVLTAVAGVSSRSRRWKPRGAMTWILGALSGFFGGVVGNQGGLRAAGLSAFALEPAVFVGTLTVVGVMIDLVRLPIYLYRTSGQLAGIWGVAVLAVVGVIAGTLVGGRVLLGLSRDWFRVVVSIAVGLLGMWFLIHPV